MAHTTPELNPESVIIADSTSLVGSELEKYASQATEEYIQAFEVSSDLGFGLAVLVVSTGCFLESLSVKWFNCAEV